MRILFFGEDESMRHMAESLTNVEAVHCTDFKEAQSLLKEWDKDRGDELEIFVSILDLSLGIKELDKFAKKTKKLDGHYRCVFAYTQDLADLKSYQKTKWACDGQLLGPMSLEGLQEIVSDFETVYYLDELEEDEEVELTELESDAVKELENLDEDKEDYDTTESGMVLPDEFQKEGTSPSQNQEDTVEVDQTAEVAIFHNNPTHKKIQEVFDHVFKYGKKSNPSQASEDLVLPEDDAEEEAASQSEAKMAEPKDEEIGLEFDLPDDEESLDEEEEVQASDEKKATEKQEDEDDDGLDFELSFDDDEEESSPAPDPAKQDSEKSEEDDSELGELSFGGDDEDEEGSSFEESTAELLADDHSPLEEESNSEEGGFEFDAEEDSDEDSLDLSSEGYDADAPVEKASPDESSPGDLEFGEDEDEDDGLSFELGGASEAEGASEQEQEASDSPGDLDFGDDDDEENDELQMSDVGASDRPTSEQADESDDFGDLDLSSDSDEDLDATKLAAAPIAQDAASSTDDEDDTKDKVDQTISQIVRSEASDDLSGQSDEEATGDFDLPDGLPSELTDDMMSEESTDSQDFSVDEWKDGDLEEKPAGEDTNPTVVTSGHDLKEKTQSNTDETPAGFELSDDDEEDFDFAGVDANSLGEDELEKTVVQERNETPKEFKVSHSDAAPAPKGLSAYAEDELTRLQSTIRQLREERDENHKQIQELKKESRLIEQEGLSEKAELDELKIEISILKKRHKNEVEELRYQLKLADEKKQIYEERCRNYQKEFERLNQKVRIEFNQVKQREKELESQLELVTMDTEAQVQSRDGKILELKRKIDSLEFNMENASIREQKSREDKARLEERLTKIMSTLRGSIQLLEDDNDSIDPSVDGDTDEKI